VLSRKHQNSPYFQAEMISAMHYRYRIPFSSSKAAYPFVCRLLPFVCFKYPPEHPLVCKKTPSVRNKGFTLIELIITVTIVGILAALAYPSFRNLILNTRIKSVASELAVTLNTARSEAIKQKSEGSTLQRVITVCVSQDGSTCTGTNWADGWIVWSDKNSNLNIDDGEIVRVAAAAPQNITITFTASSLQFNLDGTSATTGAFQVCDSVRSGETGRQVVIGAIGTVSVSNFICS